MPDGRSTYRYPSRIFDPAIGVCSGLMVYLAHRGTFGTQWYILYLVHHHGIFREARVYLEITYVYKQLLGKGHMYY